MEERTTTKDARRPYLRLNAMFHAQGSTGTPSRLTLVIQYLIFAGSLTFSWCAIA